MKQIIYNAQTKEITTVNILDTEMPIDVALAELTVEERISSVETDVDEIVTVLGALEGVTV